MRRISTPLCLAFAATLIGPISSPALAAERTRTTTLTVTPERADALYSVGESVTFNIRLVENGQPVDGVQVNWVISQDGVPPTQTGDVMMKNGAATVSGKLAEPGFLSCRANYRRADRTLITAIGGAGFDPLKIGPSLPVPQDFDEFWAEQKRQLAQIPVKPQFTPVESPQADIACFDVQCESVAAPVSSYLAKPAHAEPHSLPAILTVHGAGVRSSVLGGAVGWASRGFLAMDMNAHGLPNGRPNEYYDELSRGELKDYRIRGRESRDTVYFRGMFLRLVRAIDILTSQPEWDGRVMAVSGSSQGGAQALVAAGLDSRVTFLAAGVPAMCDHTGIVVKRINGWPKFIASDTAGPPDPKVIEAVQYYDAMNFATRTKAGAMVTVGFADTTCPPTSVYAAYNALTGPKQIFNDPPSGHAMSPPAAEAMRDAVLRHVRETK